MPTSTCSGASALCCATELLSQPSGHPAPGRDPSPVLGIDVGGTKVLGVAMAGGRVLARHRVATPAGGPALLDALEEVAGQLGVGGAQGRAAVGVGVGVPGLVDREGVLRFAPNLPGVVDLPVGELLAKRLSVAVAVDNDATCALRAEHALGAARGASQGALVTLGTGIGGGLLVDGRPTRGAHGLAGEVGHMVLVAGGRSCPCGRRGCWERYASGGALGERARQLATGGRAGRVLALAGGDPAAVRGEHVTVAAREGDPDAAAMLDELAGWLAEGLLNLALTLDPEVLVIGGGLMSAGEVLLRPVRDAFWRRTLAVPRWPAVRIVAAELGGEAGAVGAGLLAGEIAAGPGGPRG